jgi:CYTH domain-containing protein
LSASLTLIDSALLETRLSEAEQRDLPELIAEIELESEDQPVIKPDWLGEEVTGIPEYYNVNLIK